MSFTSTETLMGQEKVDGNDEAAKIFLLGGDPDAETGKLDPNDPAITFILNSDDFVNLQKYVRACTALPSTEALFEAEFSRENLKKFFAEDDTLYEYMKQVLPRMHKRANDFQVDTIEPMITLGGRIGNFAKDSGNYIGTIVSSLMVMGEPGMVKGNLKFDAAKRRADTMLDRLTDHAKKVEVECGEMFKKLTKFKVDTETVDLKDIIEIERRLKKIIPNDEAKKSKVQKLIDDAKLLVTQAKDMLDAEVQKAREAGKTKWYHYIPVVGTIILIIDIVKHKGLINSLRELNDRFELAKKKGENAIETITAASHQLDSLTNDIKGVTDTIDNAIKSVGKMQATFGNLQTMFMDIKQKLGYITSDVNDEFISDYVVPLEDLKDAAETWKRVYALSRIFQSTGLVQDAKDAPGQGVDEKTG
ncbi:hypothetical protein B0J13DRAFT_614178 [Dactylonectria estremocensis]|uniref:Uncharacterized protein n=1 Tax=Dactylonectria estremocensis TaxID=1079267 RepID=A0A9P9I9I0_9HYPO|nr:hypothetical protein B0J13DRAFT_614178 [Dactylonectria estremocensis]